MENTNGKEPALRVLHLTLKKKWFDMIASGEKKEEYREKKPYWWSRLLDRAATNQLSGVGPGAHYVFKEFDYIHFSDGYNKPRRVNVKWEGVHLGIGKPKWGAKPGKEYFVIKLGEIINHNR